MGVGVERGFGSGGAEPGVEEGGVERLGGVEIGRFCCGGGRVFWWRGGVAVVWGSDVGLERGDLGEEVVLGEVADGWTRRRRLLLLLLLLFLLARCKKIIFHKTSKRHNFLRPIGFSIATPDFDRDDTVATESFVQKVINVVPVCSCRPVLKCIRDNNRTAYSIEM